jgi:hypothetical protein
MELDSFPSIPYLMTDNVRTLTSKQSRVVDSLTEQLLHNFDQKAHDIPVWPATTMTLSGMSSAFPAIRGPTVAGTESAGRVS